jgi:hypothetical protein
MDSTTAAAGAIAANQAIQQIKPLLTELIQRVKDDKTALLVSQIQTHQQTILAAYFEAKQEAINLASENFELKRRVAKIEDEQPKLIASVQAGYEETIAELDRQLHAQNAPPEPQIGEGESSFIRLMATSGGRAYLEEMARRLGVPMVKAQYFIDGLKTRGFVRNSGALAGRGNEWALTAPGNKYAVENGLADGLPPAQPSGGPVRA